MNDIITELKYHLRVWSRDCVNYKAQVEEARAKGLPHETTLGMMTALREVTRTLENLVKQYE